MNQDYSSHLARIINDQSIIWGVRLSAMSAYIAENFKRPGGPGRGLYPAILSLPNITAEQMAELISLVYIELKDPHIQKRFASALRKELSLAHEGLRDLIYKYPSSWQNMPRKYMWLTPQITIGRVRFENRFEVRQFYPKGEMYPED